MRGVYVAHFEACSFTGQTARAQGRYTALVGNFRQRVVLVHKLGQLARTEELFNRSGNRLGVDQVLGHRWQQRAARAAHWVIYGLLLAIFVSGYLISTADGRAIDVFNWFSVPATLQGLENQEDIAGVVHEWLAWILMGLVLVHGLAAFKHHFVNKDNTLRKMLGVPPRG